jgi:hypothetical protein
MAYSDFFQTDLRRHRTIMQAEQCNRFRHNHIPFPARPKSSYTDKIVVNEAVSIRTAFSIHLESSWKFIPSRPPFWPSGSGVGLTAKEPFGRIAK